MASRKRQRQYAFALSVIGHALIVIALTFSIPLSSSNPNAGLVVIPIETSMIDETELNAAIAEVEAEQQAAIQRERQEQQRIERERVAAEQAVQRQRDEDIRREGEQVAAERERIRIQQEEAAEREQLAREQAEAEQRAEEEARQREVEAERQRQEALALQRAEEARQRRLDEVAAEVARAAAAETQGQAAANSGLRDQWAASIRSRVERYWNRPPSVTTDLECRLIVTQLPDGSVLEVSVEQCNTSDETIIRSLENAVLNASPLPQRPAGVVFERTIRMLFKPTE